MARKKKSLELEPLVGRADVLSYKVAERIVRKIGEGLETPDLWDLVKGDVEKLVRELIPNEQLFKAEHVMLASRIMQVMERRMAQ